MFPVNVIKKSVFEAFFQPIEKYFILGVDGLNFGFSALKCLKIATVFFDNKWLPPR